jgi:hypothetical protein
LRIFDIQPRRRWPLRVGSWAGDLSTDSSTDDKTDPYPLIGSGTTGVPAVQTSRRWIGYEPNHEYVELASERVEAE